MLIVQDILLFMKNCIPNTISIISEDPT